MSACERLSDRMPDVVAGGEWSAAEAAHMAGCADCTAEWTIIQEAAALGVAFTLRRDPAAIARAVLDRVAEAKRAERRRTGIVRRAAGTAAAASIIVAAWVTLHRPPAASPNPITNELPVASSGTLRAPDSTATLTLDIAELDGLSTAELKDLLDRMDVPLSTGRTVDPSRAGDLTHDELERVLRSLEG
jgi:hypothetical protein